MRRARCGPFRSLLRSPWPVMLTQKKFGLQRTPRNPMLQRQPVQKLHHDEGLAFTLTDFVDGTDVGMIFRADAARASRPKRSRTCGSLATSSGRNFRATKRP